MIETGLDVLLQVHDLRVSFEHGGRRMPVIDRANLSLGPREALGIVGESGSGKTMLCRSLLGTLRRHGAVVVDGSIRFKEHELARASEGVWRRIRGREIGYVPQSSLAGLNPILSVGTQLVEAIAAVRPIARGAAEREAEELLDLVRIPRARQVLRQRSKELSGGMRQRVMIAAALAQRPALLVADEPTTALDVTVQREILNLIGRLRVELGMALILVSHDLAVVEDVCDQVLVMYAGATVEVGPVGVVARFPRHPYSRALRTSRVDLADPGEALETIGGDPPTIGSWPAGCRFWPRCPLAADECRIGAQPGLRPFGPQETACLRAELMPSGDGIRE